MNANYDEKIDKMVALIKTGQYELPPPAPTSVTATFEKQEEFVDLKREIKGIMTELVTNEFLRSQDYIAKYINLINHTFSTAIEKYKQQYSLPEYSIFFVFKGGNVLRIVANKFMRSLPGVVSEILDKYYGASFKKSDADFSIYIDTHLENYEKIFKDMTTLAYLLLNQIRNELYPNVDKYFDFYRYNDKNKKEILQEYLDRLNSSNSIKNEEINPLHKGQFISLLFNKLQVKNRESTDDYDKMKLKYNFGTQKDGTKLDYVITEQNQNSVFLYSMIPFHKLDQTKNPLINEIIDDQKKIYGDQTSTHFYVTANDTLKFHSPDKKIYTYFNLVRMKANFKTEFVDKDDTGYVINTNGEMIDVSISHKSSSEMDHFFDDDMKSRLHKYTFEAGENSFEFLSYSIDYLMYDLETILFKQPEYPWEDRKYAKRIRRLLFLYFVDMITNLKGKTLAQMQKYLIAIKSFCVLPFTSINSIKDINEYTKHVENFLNKTDSYQFHFRKILKQVIRVGKKTNINIQEFHEFMRLLNENLNIINSIIAELTNYIRESGSVSADDLHNFSFF